MKKIMIVDDEILVRIGIKSILNWEEYGYLIAAEAQNGAEALEKIKDVRPDIVLTDLMMEPVDGFELIKTCGKEYPDIKFIVLSNYNDFDNVKRAMKMGAYDYIFKLTAKPDEILRIMNELADSFEQNEKRNSSAAADDENVRKNSAEMKSRIIESIIHQTYSSEDNVAREFKNLGLAASLQQPYSVLYISINDYFSVDFNKDFIEINLLKFAMENIIHEVMSKSNRVEVFNYHNGDLIIVINPEDNTAYEKLCRTVSEDFDTIREYIRRYLGVGITASLCPIHTGISQFASAIKINLRILSKKLAEGDNKLYIYDFNTRPEIERIKKYILDNIGGELNVSVAARYTNMSQRMFWCIISTPRHSRFTVWVTPLPCPGYFS